MKEPIQNSIQSLSFNNPTVEDILRYRWEEFKKSHSVREIEEKEVEKMLYCRSGMNGIFVYTCERCHETVYQLLGCNSRLCSRCGKRYTEQWARKLSRKLVNVPHRHFVFSVPSQIWPYLKQDRSLWKVYMDSAIETCNDYFPKIMRKHNARVGIVVIFHPFGKAINFYPHLHLIITEGGFDGKGHFIPKKFIPADGLRRTWQYHVSKNLQEAGLPNNLFTELYQKYKKGFYVWIHRAGRIDNPRDIAEYIGRYVRHPAIANTRIVGFNGKTVEFYYEEENEDGYKTTHYVKMNVDEFISNLIQHTPDRQFKMIRHYGIYARTLKRFFLSRSLQSSITFEFQDILYMFGWKSKPYCPYCGGKLRFERFETIPPPGDFFHWEVKKEDLVKFEYMMN